MRQISKNIKIVDIWWFRQKSTNLWMFKVVLNVRKKPLHARTRAEFRKSARLSWSFVDIFVGIFDNNLKIVNNISKSGWRHLHQHILYSVENNKLFQQSDSNTSTTKSLFFTSHSFSNCFSNCWLSEWVK